MVLDNANGLYVTGSSASVNFPGTAGGAQAARAGGVDAFVAKLDRSLQTAPRSTYLGGSNNDVAYAIARSSDGAVYVTGSTASVNFPRVAGGAQATPSTGGEAFVAKLDDALTTLVQATYLGGSLIDDAYGIGVATDGTVYVAGDTASANFPRTAGGAQPVSGGATDGFIARLDASLATIIQATYLGGNGDDVANALVIDATGTITSPAIPDRHFRELPVVRRPAPAAMAMDSWPGCHRP